MFLAMNRNKIKCEIFTVNMYEIGRKKDGWNEFAGE